MKSSNLYWLSLVASPDFARAKMRYPARASPLKLSLYKINIVLWSLVQPNCGERQGLTLGAGKCASQ
ncbi:MAG TPA: hypothetical protein V6D14_11265 [Coleofasciculaceae cyanobacterium]